MKLHIIKIIHIYVIFHIYVIIHILKHSKTANNKIVYPI